MSVSRKWTAGTLLPLIATPSRVAGENAMICEYATAIAGLWRLGTMMRFRLSFLLGGLLLSVPLAAQPPARPLGPWAADADGDGRITRAEMRAWMERRFALMDVDGDGLVPVEAMQRMLGHERQDGGHGGGASQERQGGREGGREGGGFGRGAMGGGGMGRGGMGHGGMRRGGPSSGDRLAGTGRSDAASSGPPGSVMPYPEDSNDDGQIDREEFVAPALAMFDELDRNGDGVLTEDELPRPHPRSGDDPPR